MHVHIYKITKYTYVILLILPIDIYVRIVYNIIKDKEQQINKRRKQNYEERNH
jgi:hypothetical protein